METKRCSRCKCDKPFSEFYKNRAQPDGYANYCKGCYKLINRERVERDPDYWKKEYHKNRHRQLAYHKEYYKANRELCKAKHKQYYQEHREEILAKQKVAYDNAPSKKKRRRGLSKLAKRCGCSIDVLEEFYSRVIIEQNGKCAICGVPEIELTTRLHIDHDHNTNELRGLLCGWCNTAIGLLRHDDVILDNAKRYLQRGYGLCKDQTKGLNRGVKKLRRAPQRINILQRGNYE
jgi:hypothetical protein